MADWRPVGRILGSGRPARATWASAASTATPTSGPASTPAPGPIAAGPQHLHSFADDVEFCALLAGCFVVPRVELQAAFDQNGAAFGEVFAGDFCLAPPQRHLDESRLFAAAVRLLVEPVAVDCQADLGEGRSRWRVPHLRITGEIAQENHLIEAGHDHRF